MFRVPLLGSIFSRNLPFLKCITLLLVKIRYLNFFTSILYVVVIIWKYWFRSFLEKIKLVQNVVIHRQRQFMENKIHRCINSSTWQYIDTTTHRQRQFIEPTNHRQWQYIDDNNTSTTTIIRHDSLSKRQNIETIIHRRQKFIDATIHPDQSIKRKNSPKGTYKLSILPRTFFGK